MRKILMTLAAVLCCGIQSSAWAQSPEVKGKMSPWLRGKYQQHQAAVRRGGGQLRSQGKPVRSYVLALVQSTDEAAVVRRKGGVVWQDFGGGVCAAFLPMDSMETIGLCPSVLRLEANEPSRLLNDTSAVLTGVDKLAGGLSPELPQAFTGKGVIAGVVDVGFDFTHPAFRNDDGSSRIKWFWDPLAPDADNDLVGMVYSSPEQVLAARHCINADVDNHGSHVLGSMAGNGLDGRYVGMAPEADIIGTYLPMGATTEELIARFADYIRRHIDSDLPMDGTILSVDPSDAIDLVEIFRLFQQATAAGKPCVVNCSFGSKTDFFFDGTLYEHVLESMLGPGRIVVAAAGNSGLNMLYLKKEANQPLNIGIYYGGYIDYYDFSMRTNPGTDFKVGFTFPNVADTVFIDSRDIFAAMDTGFYFITSIPEVDVCVHVEDAPYNKTGYKLKTIFKGDYLREMTRTNDNVTRVEGKIIIDTPVEVEVAGDETNEFVVILGDENPLTSRGCHLGTIGYPASVERVITVGAMHHRTSFTNVLGETNTTQELASQEGHLAAFSSCGPTMNGLTKPDVVASGHNIVSTLNSFYRYNHNDNLTYNKVVPLTTYISDAYGQTYAMWAMSGTSMASPIAAGVIALWLQAKPDLTPEDIKGVIQRTSHQPEPEFSGTGKNNYYGWGEIDAYAGLLDILGLDTSIPSLSKHQPTGLSFRLVGHTLYIDGLDDTVPVSIYTTDGSLVTTTTLQGGAIQLSNLLNGVYAVQVGKLGSTLIRLE